MLKDLILFGVKGLCLQCDLQGGIFCPRSFGLQAVHEGSGAWVCTTDCEQWALASQVAALRPVLALASPFHLTCPGVVNLDCPQLLWQHLLVPIMCCALEPKAGPPCSSVRGCGSSHTAICKIRSFFLSLPIFPECTGICFPLGCCPTLQHYSVLLLQVIMSLIPQLTSLSLPFSHGKILVNTVGVQVVCWVFGEELGPFLFGVFSC